MAALSIPSRHLDVIGFLVKMAVSMSVPIMALDQLLCCGHQYSTMKIIEVKSREGMKAIVSMHPMYYMRCYVSKTSFINCVKDKRIPPPPHKTPPEFNLRTHYSLCLAIRPG